MTIEKPRSQRRGRRGGVGPRGRRSGRRKERLRTEAEQLDYEMELLRAQREGREEEFKTEERAKLRARAAANLDAEMDEYFKKKEEKSGEDAEPGKADEAGDTSNGDQQKVAPPPPAAAQAEAASS